VAAGAMASSKTGGGSYFLIYSRNTAKARHILGNCRAAVPQAIIFWVCVSEDLFLFSGGIAHHFALSNH
jgi:hypothetical protein